MKMRTDISKNSLDVYPEMQEQLAKGERFGFGENWRAFLSKLTQDRIVAAEMSLKTRLEVDSLEGKSFLDVGSGSGLFSLAARRLGALVHSFDYDPVSVECTRDLRRRYFPNDPGWTVEQGSVLDESYVRSLGQFDVVYSFGVLHHTGDMWKALDLVVSLTKPEGGKMFVALYNDQGGASRRWKSVKKTYCRAPFLLKPLIFIPAAFMLCWRQTLSSLIRNQSIRRFDNPNPRGMSLWHDLIDWIGGYPFEVAKPGDVCDFYFKRGFLLRRLRTVGGGLANNEFMFERYQ